LFQWPFSLSFKVDRNFSTLIVCVMLYPLNRNFHVWHPSHEHICKHDKTLSSFPNPLCDLKKLLYIPHILRAFQNPHKSILSATLNMLFHIHSSCFFLSSAGHELRSLEREHRRKATPSWKVRTFRPDQARLDPVDGFLHGADRLMDLIH